MAEMVKGTRPQYLELTFPEFLDFVKVVKMLYGRNAAERCFAEKIKEWYNLDSASLLK